MEKLVQVDGKVRTDIKFPAGFMGMYTTPGFYLSCKLVCLLACMHPPMTGDGLRKHLCCSILFMQTSSPSPAPATISVSCTT